VEAAELRPGIPGSAKPQLGGITLASWHRVLNIGIAIHDHAAVKAEHVAGVDARRKNRREGVGMGKWMESARSGLEFVKPFTLTPFTDPTDPI
jgi:hypothetical protein